MTMKNSIFKLTWRSIKTFFGRYLALLLIVALSAGFFAGLKITTDAMEHTGDEYMEEQGLYDYRVFSAVGFTREDVDKYAELPYIKVAEGTNSVDAMVSFGSNSRPYKLLAVTEETNLASLVAGRMPAAKNECVVDDERFDEDDIGKKIRISDENDATVTSLIDGDEFTIVGIVNSPLYLSLDRGTTSIGSGAVHAYVYLSEEAFAGDTYTEINLLLGEREAIYSDEYDELVEKYEAEITDMAGEYGYVLTRNENAGYVSFENDISIISGVANIFPIFFILIAMLVCITTMTRMVDEERTQIGVLKALGYSDMAIMAKYLLYAGSATLLGWAVGYFVCTWGLPLIFWSAYGAIYDFALLLYLFSPELAVLTLAVSLISILGSTFISCRKELVSVPAQLIRPRAAKNGKRILLERISVLWNRLSFLQKITLRNMFRYKRRLIMMLVGIGCCAGLVVTAFGVRDSMIDIGELQFEKVQKYNVEATFTEGSEENVRAKLDELEKIDRYDMVSVRWVDVIGEETMNSVNLMSFDDTDSLGEFWDFHNGEETVAYPEKGEAVINRKIAEKLNVAVGDSIEIRDSDMQTCTVTVSGIFDNYIYNYVVVSAETYEDVYGQWQANTALISVNGDTEDTAKVLTKMSEIKSVSQLSKIKENVDNALSCLDYIIWLIVLFSGALAFIVIFNLTNINLAERSREIATVQVLGFYPKETESYVLRENLVLSVLASVIGLPLGTLFHHVVMSMVLIDSFSFNMYVAPESYVLAFVCTVLFAVIVNLFMKRQIAKIHMAESLKAVE